MRFCLFFAVIFDPLEVPRRGNATGGVFDVVKGGSDSVRGAYPTPTQADPKPNVNKTCYYIMATYI